jgi:hypothetical protein
LQLVTAPGHIAKMAASHGQAFVLEERLQECQNTYKLNVGYVVRCCIGQQSSIWITLQHWSPAYPAAASNCHLDFRKLTAQPMGLFYD